jgi:hypothetical protein
MVAGCSVQGIHYTHGSDVGELGVILQEVGWEHQKEDIKLHLFQKNRFGEIKSCNLRIHDTHSGFTQCQQGLQRDKKKTRSRK